MSRSALLNSVQSYYSHQLNKFGATPRGVDWNSSESQTTRFTQLLRICDGIRPTSVGDYGCGYGALADYLSAHGYLCTYRGYDVCDAMICAAREKYTGCSWATFENDDLVLEGADFVVASGVFNVKIDAPREDWEKHVLESLSRIANLARRGFAFNALTSYSDRDKMRSDLYYADPCYYFDICKRLYSKQVALLHDYGLYEFTILVRY